ncbi:hypothetical protein EIP86_009806 [Pleurotus ostreatoroseus]|nr:hypothetical protein EIP86_009806 [Pleurotus ostreatoroseus]
MSTNSSKDQARRRRKSPKPPKDDTTSAKEGMPRSPRAQSTSLESIQIQPRTPKTAATRVNGSVPEWTPDDALASEEVELSLLGESERRDAADGLTLEEEQAYLGQSEKRPMSTRDKRAIALLIVLYLIQGFPLGLALGRRKSWIIPMQLIIGTLMLIISTNAEEFMNNPSEHIYTLSAAFTTLVTLSATQGWALTLLSHENLPYASTCQTIGLNTGYFASFTVFLAFNSESFSISSFCVTLWLLFVKEDKEVDDEDLSIKSVYTTMWSICKLKHVQTLCIMHLFAKIGWAANDAVTQLKMVEKGLGREDLAVAVLIDFPFQMFAGWVAGRWSRGDKPLRPWMLAFWPRLVLCLIATLTIYWFPAAPISTGFFVYLIIMTVMSSFAGSVCSHLGWTRGSQIYRTVQFGGISAFHTRIADPVVGGTYMTVRYDDTA